MSEHMRFVCSGVDVSALHQALRAMPDLWDLHRARTAPEGSPHHGCHDIWVRYKNPIDRTPPGAPHESVWYAGVRAIPEVFEIVFPLLAIVGGERLGGILLTKIDPGGEVKPHVDEGWHADYYSKYLVQITAAPGQKFCYEDGEVETKAGEVWQFENNVKHWVTNPTGQPRISLICCIRTSKHLGWHP